MWTLPALCGGWYQLRKSLVLEYGTAAWPVSCPQSQLAQNSAATYQTITQTLCSTAKQDLTCTW